MKNMSVAAMRNLFTEPMSACCGATVHNGTCCHCGNAVAVPFYFASSKPIPDELAIKQEARMRPLFPVGWAVAAWIVTAT